MSNGDRNVTFVASCAAEEPKSGTRIGHMARICLNEASNYNQMSSNVTPAKRIAQFRYESQASQTSTVSSGSQQH